jgi:hypothetical protein
MNNTGGHFDKFRAAVGMLGLHDFTTVPAVCRDWRDNVYEGGWAARRFVRHEVCRRLHRATSRADILRGLSWINQRGSWYEFGRWPSDGVMQSPQFRRMMDTAMYFDTPELLQAALLVPVPAKFNHLHCYELRRVARLLLNSHMKADPVYMPMVSTSPWRLQWLLEAERGGAHGLQYLTARPVRLQRYLLRLSNHGASEHLHRHCNCHRKGFLAQKLIGFERFDAREDVAWNDYGVDVRYSRKLTVMSRTFIDPERAVDCVEDNQRHKEFDKFWSASRWGIVGLDLNAVHMRRAGRARKRLREEDNAEQ